MFVPKHIRADCVRTQLDAMGHAIDARKRRDMKIFWGAVGEIQRMGKKLGHRPSEPDAQPYLHRE